MGNTLELGIPNQELSSWAVALLSGSVLHCAFWASAPACLAVGCLDKVVVSWARSAEIWGTFTRSASGIAHGALAIVKEAAKWALGALIWFSWGAGSAGRVAWHAYRAAIGLLLCRVFLYALSAFVWIEALSAFFRDHSQLSAPLGKHLGGQVRHLVGEVQVSQGNSQGLHWNAVAS
jgi:hypothetical protein